jgi:hypothetical protein
VSLATVGPATGHGFDLDATSIEQVAQLAEGNPGRWTHGTDSDEALGTHLGYWRNVTRDGEHARGDFEFSALAHKTRPAGLDTNAADYLLTAAEADPGVVGASVVIDYCVEQLSAGEDAPGAKVARIAKVHRADFVADPAANRRGLFSAKRNPLNTPSGSAAEVSTMSDTDTASRANLAARVETAEAQLSAANAKLSALQASHDEATKQLDEAQAELARRDKEAADAQAEADAAYVAKLKADAAEAQQPLDPDKLEQVEALLQAGNRDAAKIVGDALLDAALARAGKPAALATKGGEKLGSDDNPKLASLKTQARVLRSRGWTATVEQDADGNPHLNAQPPARG